MIVCIAEKPSVAKDIARILGATKPCDGFYYTTNVCPVNRFCPQKSGKTAILVLCPIFREAPVRGLSLITETVNNFCRENRSLALNTPHLLEMDTKMTGKPPPSAGSLVRGLL